MTSGQTAGQGLPHRRLREGTQTSEVSGGRGECGGWWAGQHLPDQLQLQNLLVGLEDGLLLKQLSQNAPGP